MVFSSGFVGRRESASSSSENVNIELPLSNSIDSTSTNTGASSYAVKLVNDKLEAKLNETKEELDSKLSQSVNMLQTANYKVKSTTEDSSPNYLENKVDNVTVEVDDNTHKLVIKSLKGLTIGVTDINNWLNGTSSNIQGQINNLKQTVTTLTSGMKYLGKVETYADLLRISTPENGSLVVVLSDEDRNKGRSLYVYSKNLGSWDFVGEFTFANEFIELEDTPSNYVGHNNKLLKVDETNKKISFDFIDWNEIKNKPSSDIVDIDNSVQQSHSHQNKELLDTYTQTNSDLVNAVTKSHSHANITTLDKVGMDADGNLIFNEKVYQPKTQKSYLYVRRSTNTTITTNQNVVFNTKVNGTVPYDVSNGSFTLTKGKVYRITAKVFFDFKTTGWVKLQVVDSDTGTFPTEAYNMAYCTDVAGTWHESPGGLLDFIIIPTSTRYFYVRVTGTDGGSGTTYTLRDASTMVITEL